MKRFLALFLAALLALPALSATAEMGGCIIGNHTMGDWMYI